MAFNPLEYLKDGKVDFLQNSFFFNKDELINNIRNASNRNEIINGFLNILINQMPHFCFNIIHDLEEYKLGNLYLLNKYISYKDITNIQLRNILFKTSWGKEYVMNNLTEILNNEDKVILIVIEYIFSDFEKNYDLVNIFYLNSNLHIRYLFMKYIVENIPKYLDIIYDDFTKYLTSITYKKYEQLTFIPTLMDISDICNLAVSVLSSSLNKKYFNKLKEYILSTYKENKLASALLTPKLVHVTESKKDFVTETSKKDAFQKDADKLFTTSIDYKYQIYIRYANLISKNILENFQALVEKFQNPNSIYGFNYDLEKIFSEGLGSKLELYVDKYLSLSKTHETKYLTRGHNNACYQIGDYIFKLVCSKWSKEDIICPNLYLILENLEEIFVRNNQGLVISGIEIQKKLTRSAKHIPKYIFDEWKKELRRLGYYFVDTLIDGPCGDNSFLLNSYKDAYHPNPENLPDWFKEYPLVLVDRDDVYRLINKNPRVNRTKFFGE